MRKEIIGDATLYLGVCLEVMEGFEHGSVDAVVTDPPYCSGGLSESSRASANGQGVRSKIISRFGWFQGDNMGTAGLAWLIRAIAVRSFKIIKSEGSLLLFCDWRMTSSLQPAIESAGWRSQGIVVWDKKHFGMGRGFRNQHEFILHFTAGAPVYYSASIGNVIQADRVGPDREHQTEKPASLIGVLLEVVSTKAQTILDPFMGSGTTGVACANLGRKFIGIEIEEKYFDIACRRIEQAASQVRMDFDAAGKPEQMEMSP